MEKETEKQAAGFCDAEAPGFHDTEASAFYDTEVSGFHDTFVPLSELNLSNGFLFGEVMRDEETCRTVLEIILRRPVGRVVYVNKEQEMESGTCYHKYKGIRLDVYFKDDADTCYSVDMQTQERYNLAKRSRHYQGMMDVQMLPAGEIDYNKLCDSIIIFICTFDLFGKGRICYTFESMCREVPGLKLPDGAVRIFLNTEGEERSETDRTLAEFLRYVVDKDAPVESPAVKKIKKRVEEVKRDQEMEARYMTSLTHAREVYEDGRIEGEARGLARGRAEGEARGLSRGRAEGEARGLSKGKIQSILDLLGELGDIPESLRERIEREEDPETLGRWVKLAARAESFPDFEEKM